jgi:serine/threonine protein kinase
LLSRRNGAVTLKGHLQIETRRNSLPQIVKVEKKIEPLRVELKDLFTKLLDVHDDGEQCRIERVRSKEDGKEYILKIQKKSQIRTGTQALFRRMTERMMNLPESEHVVRVHACFEDSQYFYTLQEACDGGDLFDFLRVLLADETELEYLESEVRKVVREVLLSLCHLHEQGLVHRDVKLENLVFKRRGVFEPRKVGCAPQVTPPPLGDAEPGTPQSPSMLKLIDFDFTEEWEPLTPSSKAVVGTDGYIAPELFLGNFSPKSDIFSVGVIMYVLITNRYPYDDTFFDHKPGENVAGSSKMVGIHRKLKAADVRFGTSWDGLDEAKGFCQWLLAFEAADRPTASEALKHPWIASGDARPSPPPGEELASGLVGAACA